MTSLENHQFEILPSADAQDGFVFGVGAAVSLDEDGFDPGEREWSRSGGINTRRGVRASGRDVKAPKTWLWASHVDQHNVASAVDVLEQFSAAWDLEDVMLSPGEQTCIRYRLANRDRRIFGRPGRFSAPPTNLILNGFIPVTHDFELVDSYTYDDLESSAQIPYSTSAEGGGFTLPAQMPITTLPSEGLGAAQLTVGGTARAYPIVRFNGPWTNPGIDTGDWRFDWRGSIPIGDYVEIDFRPWVLTIRNKNGASVSKGADTRTYLEDCWFAPGSQPQISLKGSAPGGGASATIRWRNTWTSL